MECQGILKKYLQWLEEETEIAKNGEECNIILPFLSPDGDHIEIASKPTTSGLLFSDKGYTYDFM